MTDGLLTGASEIQFDGRWTHAGGTIEVGHNIGKTRIRGEYFNTNGILQVQLNGTRPVIEHDVLEIDTIATLGGTLDLQIVDGYLPTLGDSFTILNSGVLFGTFHTIQGVSQPSQLAPGVGLAVTYDSIFDDVTVTTALLGDANLDGVVDSDDFNILAFNFGDKRTTWIDGDFTGDGVVGSDDFNLLAFNFGQNSDLSQAQIAAFNTFAASLAVPEPGSLALLGLGGLLTLRRRVG
jgi:hypothetical protein